MCILVVLPTEPLRTKTFKESFESPSKTKNKRKRRIDHKVRKLY